MRFFKNIFMHRFFPVMVLAGIVFSIISCDQSVNLNGPFSEKYILYCLLNGDSTRQKAYLSKSYSVSNFDPFENTTDPAVQGAVVRIVENANTLYEKVYNMTEAIGERSDTSRYKSPLKYYYTSNYALKSASKVKITAALKNGMVLTSSTLVPYLEGFFNFSTYTITGYNPASSYDFEMSWTAADPYYRSMVSYSLARFDLVYHKADAPDKKYRIKMPVYFLHQTDKYVPVYQDVTTNKSIKIYKESFDRMMAIISEGDPDKGSYIFEPSEFSITLLDNNLANYINSEETFNNEFSMRIESADYSSVEGGLGIFGVYTTRTSYIKLTKAYLASFGYNAAY